MKKAICITALSLILCSCASDKENSSKETEPVQTTTMIASVSESETPKVEYKTIIAEVTGYKDGKLEFTYEGQEYKVACPKKNFVGGSPFTYPTLSEQIIYNKFGETITGKLRISSEMSEITKCDVVTPNGSEYSGFNVYNADRTVNNDLLYKCKRTEGSLCTISNSKESFEFDLNDLEFYYRLDYPETIDPVLFSCYKFKDGKMFLTSLSFKVTVSEKSVSVDIGRKDYDALGKRMCFFGTVKSISDDGNTLTFMLNDNKTLCTVPTYYKDSTELKAGTEIMAVLIADSTLYGSGGEHSFDYAAISANPEYYNQTGITDERLAVGVTVDGKDSTGRLIPFSELAYSKFESGISPTAYTTVKKAN